MAARDPTLWAIFQAHLRASPKKSALLGILTVVLLGLVALQVGGGPKEAGASPMLVPLVPEIGIDPGMETSALPQTMAPLPQMPEKLDRDPFAVVFELFDPLPGTGHSHNKPLAVQEHVDQVARALEDLTLESTVTGSTPIATINGMVVRVGDLTHGFAVRQIGVRLVVLTFGDREFVLTMD